MKKEGAFVGFFKRLKNDYAFRTFCSAVCSFTVTLIFTGYNVFLAARYRTSWNAGIAIYYALLVGLSCSRPNTVTARQSYRPKSANSGVPSCFYFRAHLCSSLISL